MAEEEDSNYIPSFINDENYLLGETEDGNGLVFQNIYIPEEIMIQILSNIDAGELLNYTLVCRKWNNLIKSYSLWSLKYRNKYKRKAKKLPWYVYYCILSSNCFDTNLLKNGNGQEGFRHWEIVCNGGDRCRVQPRPKGADPLPADVPEFYGYTSCFVTSFGDCHKRQVIRLPKNKLFHYVLDSYKPHIYLSEWTAGRFDCGCVYVLRCGFVGDKVTGRFYKPCAIHHVSQWQGRKWEKMEITVTEYPENVEGLVFENIGRDTQFWKGHYGSKMAGGVIKFLSESIDPLPVDEQGNQIPKKFTNIRYTANGVPEEQKKQNYPHYVVHNNQADDDEEPTYYAFDFNGAYVDEDHDYY